MLKKQTLLTMAFFVFGTTLALADTSHLKNEQGNESHVNQQKWETLEAKIKVLESRINKYLPKPSPEVKLGSNPYAPQIVKKMVGWTSKDHEREASVHQQTVQTLEQEIQQLNDRIDRYSRKPYLDTKGIRRDNMKRRRGNLVRDLRAATLKTAWHQKQAKQAMVSEPVHQKPQQNS